MLFALGIPSSGTRAERPDSLGYTSEFTETVFLALWDGGGYVGPSRARESKQKAVDRCVAGQDLAVPAIVCSTPVRQGYLSSPGSRIGDVRGLCPPTHGGPVR